MTTITNYQIARLEENKVKVSAYINLNRQSHEVSFIVPGNSVYEGIEPFLTLALVPAMTVGQPIELVTPVSPRLLANIDTIQDIFQIWDKQFHRIPVNAPARKLETPASGSAPNMPGKISAGINSSLQFLTQNLNSRVLKKARSCLETKTGIGDKRKVACLFSGGVDSFYTLLKHFDEIDTLIFVSGGFDIHPHHYNQEFRCMISNRLRGVAQEMGKEFLDVEVHVQNFSGNYVNWFWYYGSAMAALAQLLSNRFHKVFFASSYPYNNLRPCGSSPLLDPLWNTEYVEIFHDGAEAGRINKILRLAKSEIAINNLRVCLNYSENREYNCGECEKCIWTMAVLRARGVFNYSAFAHQLDLEVIAAMSLPEGLIKPWEDTLYQLKEDANDPELAQAIIKCLSKVQNIKGEEKLAALKKDLAEQERLFRVQQGWARSLEEHNVWLTQQHDAANEWGHSLEKELMALRQKQK